MSGTAPKPKSQGAKASRSPRGADRIAKHQSINEAISGSSKGMIGDVRIAAGKGSSAKTRLKIAGLNVNKSKLVVDKEKVSLTLDRPLVHEIRTAFGDAAFSSTVNELLQMAMDQVRLRQLLEEMERDEGSASPAAYDRVIAQWLAK